jgi:Ser/Thr protein kinase RdoA (MazF antagonist)
MIWSDPTGNCEAEKSYQLLGIAIAKLSEHLDDFKAHPNNINWVRYQYKEILAELADSNLLDDLLSQLHGVPGTFKKLSNNLGELIRESAYGLC